MVVIAEGARDVTALKASVGPWIAEKWVGRKQVEVIAVTAFGGGGVSNETLRVAFVEPGQPSESYVVLRFPPVGRGVFPTYDLEREHRVLEALHAAGIPVAAPTIFEPDAGWLGEAFLAMPFVAGRVPASQPQPYVVSGWLKDLTPHNQAKVMWSFTDLLADVHRLETSGLGIEPLGQEYAGLPVRRTLSWWLSYLDWTQQGSDSAQFDEVQACYEWLVARVPVEEPPASFVWGDARLGNVAFTDDFTVSAAMDWEGATIGPAELDLGLHFAHRLNMGALINADGLPELPGFPSVQVQLDHYQARLGRPLADLTWYTVFAAAGLAANRLAVQRALASAGLPGLPGNAIRPWVKQITLEEA